MKWIWAFILFASLVLLGVLFALRQVTAYEGHSNPWLLKWIPYSCCVSNDCCWEIAENDLIELSDDFYEVKATGQRLKRKAFSPDGKFYRCACDEIYTGKWLRHIGAKTHCLFVPMRMG